MTVVLLNLCIDNFNIMQTSIKIGKKYDTNDCCKMVDDKYFEHIYNSRPTSIILISYFAPNETANTHFWVVNVKERGYRSLSLNAAISTKRMLNFGAIPPLVPSEMIVL